MEKKMCKSVVLVFILLVGFAFLIGQVPEAKAVITLTFAANTPVTHPNYKIYMTFFNKVVKDSKGEVEFKYYWGGSLLKGAEITNGIGTGTVDMGEIQTNWDVQLEPSLKLAFLPFLFDDHYHLERAADAGLMKMASDLYKKHNVKLLNYLSSGAQDWWHKSKFFKTPADFKGEHLRGLGGYASEAMRLMGANVMSLGTFEVLPALERGMIDGVGTAAPSLSTYGWEKYCKYGTFADWCDTPRGFGINIDVWNKLPRNIQDIMLRASREFQRYHYQTLTRNDYTIYYNNWIKKGFKGYKLTQSEKKEFKRFLKPLYDEALKQFGDEAKFVFDVVEKTRKTN